MSAGWKIFIYLVPARLVGNVLDVAVDLIHGLGHGGDVFLGRAGGGVVVDLVCHFFVFMEGGWDICLDKA